MELNTPKVLVTTRIQPNSENVAPLNPNTYIRASPSDQLSMSDYSIYVPWIDEIRTEVFANVTGGKSLKLAVELTGCVRTLNSTDVRDSLRAQVKQLQSMGVQVDAFGVLQMCRGTGSDEGSAADKRNIAMILKSIFAGGIVKFDWTPESFSLTGTEGKLKEEFRKDHPHYEVYEQRTPRGWKRNWHVNGTLSGYLKLKRAMQLRQSVKVHYDVVWRQRTDVFTGDIPWSQILADIPQRTEWIIPAFGFQRNNFATDTIAFMSPSAADHYDSLWGSVDSLVMEKGLTFIPEELLTKHMASVDCRMIRKPFHSICRESDSNKDCRFQQFKKHAPEHVSWCPDLKL